MLGIDTAVKGAIDKNAAKKNREYAEQQKVAGLKLINSLDYEPEYASNHVPTYQRTDSPIARSYIESFLMGNNPDAISPVSPNAGARRVQAQGQQNAMFGTPDERMARQQAFQQATPWKVTAPTRPINPNRNTAPGEASYTMEHSDVAGYGVNKNLYDALADTGTVLDKSAPGKAGLLYGVNATSVGGVLKDWYGGDADRMAADIREAGGYDALLAKHKRGR